MSDSVVICIPTFRRPRMLARLLDAIARLKTQARISVLVADNDAETHAGFDLCQALIDYRWPLIAVIAQKRGIAQARNTLIEHALKTDARFIAMIDDDEWPQDDWIDQFLKTARATGADVLLVGAIPKFAAQSIKKVHDLGWKPMFFMTNVAISVGTVMMPAGPENSVGMISTNYLKDPTDHQWDNDAGMQEWRGFMAKYMPGADLTDANYVYGYAAAKTMLQVLKQCDGNFSRENVMKQAENLHDLELPTLLPGIKVSTSHTDHRPIKAMQLQRWNGKGWVRFGGLIEGANV